MQFAIHDQGFTITPENPQDKVFLQAVLGLERNKSLAECIRTDLPVRNPKEYQPGFNVTIRAIERAAPGIRDAMEANQAVGTNMLDAIEKHANAEGVQ